MDADLKEIAEALKSVPGVISCTVEKRQVIIVTTVAKDRDLVYLKEQDILTKMPKAHIDFRVIWSDDEGESK